MKDGQGRASLDQVSAVFAVFEASLRAGAVLGDTGGLRPILFEIDTEPRVLWSFDPDRRERFFLPRRHPNPALSIYCAASFLTRILSTDPLVAREGEELLSIGDVGALRALLDAMMPSLSLTGVRVGGRP